MLKTNKIKIRDLKDMLAEDKLSPKNTLTPLRKRKNPKFATKSKKSNVLEQVNETNVDNNANTKTTKKNLLKSSIKATTPSNQKRIDSYFTSCAKTYEIKLEKQEPFTSCVKTKLKTNCKKTKSATKNKKSPRRPKAGRKRLFSDNTDATTKAMSTSSSFGEITKLPTCITIDSDSEDEHEHTIKNEIKSPPCTPLSNTNTPPVNVNNGIANQDISVATETALTNISHTFASSTTASSLPFGLRMSNTSCAISTTTPNSSSRTKSVNRRKTKTCPPYKIIEDTTFAVDAFQFGYIDKVTHYFLTHFHADHYIGLTKSFAMPIYMSPITARLLRTFIPVQEHNIHELELNKTCLINDIEVTALDANHCPGSILLVFKFPHTNKCILHTGDFRAWHGMESEPIFWNNHIHTIYLDTTYISDKYSFCTQHESITKAMELIEQFIIKHPGKRILYICGSYVIGKEKFWSKLAEEYDLKVWAEGNRYKALKAMNEERFNKLLVDEPNEANMHILSMTKVTYLELVEYFKTYQHLYDIVFAIRPSGWEKNSKPRYGSKINIVGIEYSEHSSHAEMQRFVKFLKPQQVLSTVPTGKDLMKTAKVPFNWYKYNKLKPCSNYQPSIDSFMVTTPQIKNSRRSLITRRDGVENFVSPLKSLTPNPSEINKNLTTETAVHLKPTKTDATSYNINKEMNTLQTPKPVNSYNLRLNTPHLTRTTTSKCSNNSSEYFESEYNVKKLQRINQETNNKVKTKTNESKKQLAYTTRKLQSSHQDLQQKNSINSTASDDFSRLVKETGLAKAQHQTKENPILKSTTTSIHSLSEDELPKASNRQSFKSNTQTSIAKSLQEKYDIITDTNLFNQIHMQDIKEESQELNANIKENVKETTNYKYNMSNWQNQTSSKQFNASEREFQRILSDPPITSTKILTQQHYHNQSYMEINISQKRITRSQSASSKTTTKSSNTSQNLKEKEFEAKLEKLAQQNNRLHNIKSQQNSTTTLSKINENPLFRSTTTTSIDTMSENEQPQTSNFIPNQKPKQYKKINTYTKKDSAKSSDERDSTKWNLKRSTSNHNSTPFKKSTTHSLNTSNILHNILEHNKDIDRFECSQLASKLIDTLHKLNPDNSKDHIPSDLLSDADEDWM